MKKDNKETKLSPEAFSKLNELMENPPEPTEEMKKLMSEQKLNKGDRDI